MARHNTKLNTPEKRARVGERIKVAATQAGLSLKELGEFTNTPAATIYQYVRGIIAVPTETLEKIAAVTRVHTDFFDPDKEGRSALAQPPDQPSPEGFSLGNLASEPGTRARIEAEMEHLRQLQEAHNYPKRNRASYISTLEQMLSLARTLDNRRQEAWIQWQLGRTRVEENALDDGRQRLLVARELFASEDMDDYRNMVTMDLANALEIDGSLDAAVHYLEEIVESPNSGVRWRASICLGNIRYKQHNNEEALRYFCNAAEEIEKIDPEQREREGMLYLTGTIAEIVRATGHQEEAILLWSQCLQRATENRLADHFLEALINIAQTYQQMGKLNEARQRLELAVVLAGFLFEDEARLSIARALLADLLVTMGSLEDAKDNARASLRIAHKVRAARPTIVSALALAETHLAALQWRDALDYSQEALDEAKRTKRTREVAKARELRARAYLRCQEERLANGEELQARDALNHAFAEVTAALDQAIKADAVREILAARLTLARCHFRNGDDQEAERETHAALELSETGAIGLSRLLGKDGSHLPVLLRSSDLDLPTLFSSRKIDIPHLEWQAHYLKGRLLAKRLGPEAGYEAMRDAAKLVTRMLSTLTPTEATSFQHRHPEVTSVFQDLVRCALTDKAQQEVVALLDGARWIRDDSLLPSLAALES